MVVLGIDPGLAHTGWGVIETRGDLCRARAYGCVTTHANEPIDRRLGTIFGEISRVIASYQPTQLSIEQIFFGENERSAIATAEARGVAIVACANAGLVVGEYTPAQIKHAVVGVGRANKYQVIFMVRTILALDHDPRPNHAADALAAAICHANLAHTTKLACRAASKDQLREAECARLEQQAADARAYTAAATAANIDREAGFPDAHAFETTRQSRVATRFPRYPKRKASL